MKIRFITLLVLILTLFLITKCTKDEDTETSPNSEQVYSITSCTDINWDEMGNVEVYINVVTPNNAFICSRNGGTATITVTSNEAYITYTPTNLDLTGTLGWNNSYSGASQCSVDSASENVITFEVELPSSATTLAVSTCNLWTTPSAKDNTILRSADMYFDLQNISDDGIGCDECPCNSCASTGNFFDKDNSIPIYQGKAFFIIAGFGSGSYLPAWATGQESQFIISWQ